MAGMMRAVKKICIALVFLGVSCAPVFAWEGYVTKIKDGDSFNVRKGNRIYGVRLYGVDSPEYRQSCWREASGFTRSLIQGETVTIIPMDTDQYGRIVALVRIQGRLLNSELVRNGLAWVYPKYCHAQPLCREMRALEQSAQRQGLGLWRKRGPIPPWLWRRSRR